MKSILLAAVLACLSFSAQARPSPVTSFSGDRYVAVTHEPDARAPRQHVRHRHYHRRHARHPQRGPVARRIALAEGMGREVGRATGGRPAAWCGWWLGHHLGMPLRRLWLARNWASVGSPAAPGPGVVVVWAHHVGIITGRRGNRWVIKSGNDGHRVRERPRSVARAIAFRRV